MAGPGRRCHSRTRQKTGVSQCKKPVRAGTPMGISARTGGEERRNLLNATRRAGAGLTSKRGASGQPSHRRGTRCRTDRRSLVPEHYLRWWLRCRCHRCMRRISGSPRRYCSGERDPGIFVTRQSLHRLPGLLLRIANSGRWFSSYGAAAEWRRKGARSLTSQWSPAPERSPGSIPGPAGCSRGWPPSRPG